MSLPIYASASQHPPPCLFEEGFFDSGLKPGEGFQRLGNYLSTGGFGT